MISRKNKVLITTSWDDGSRYDHKLAKLLLKYHIPATIYIPGNAELNNQEIKSLSKHFEIGGHTHSHPRLTQISLKSTADEILRNKISLENILGTDLKSFCYPYGDVNQDVKQMVGIKGYKFARTTTLFMRSIGDVLLAGTSAKAMTHFYVPWDKLAIKIFDFVNKFGGIYHLWGHSWEIEKNSDWESLERVLKHISSSSNLSQRITNGQILEIFEKNKKEYYVAKFKQKI